MSAAAVFEGDERWHQKKRAVERFANRPTVQDDVIFRRKVVGLGQLRSMRKRRGALVLGAATLSACGSSSHAGNAPAAPAAGPRVLLVGTFAGHAGRYQTIQSAVNAARAGDWILVAPGDYHESADLTG